jgi:type II secretion system protein I
MLSRPSPFRISNFEPSEARQTAHLPLLLNGHFRISPRSGAFVLIEVMLGVAIFAMGVISLGACVSNCITAESARQETEHARLALDNRMAEVEAGVIPTDKDRSDDLGDAFPGMTLKQSRRPVSAKTEKGDKILNLYQVDIEVDWTTDHEPQSRAISFYVLRSK